MGDPITCPECGFRNGPGDEFCGQCGRYLGWSTPDDPADLTGAPDAGTAPDVPVPPAPTPPTPQPSPSGFEAPPSGSHAPFPTPPPLPRTPPAPVPTFVPPPPMGGINCRTCGLVNPTGRTFCQRCGSQLDPAVGTVAGSPRPVPASSSGGGGRRLVAAGVGLVVVAAVAGAAIVFGGVLGGPAPTATPRTAVVSPSPGAATGAPTSAPESTDGPITTDPPTPTDDLGPTPTPRVTPRPTRPRSTTAAPTATPDPGDLPTPPPAGTYLCDGESVALEDPLERGWNIARVRWGQRAGFDHVYLELTRRRALDGAGARATIQVMPLDEVAERPGFVPPSVGRSAVVLTLSEGIRATLTLDQPLSFPKVRAVTAGKDPDGRQWLALGVRGETCYSLQVPAWATDEADDPSTIEVIVDIAH